MRSAVTGGSVPGAAGDCGMLGGGVGVGAGFCGMRMKIPTASQKGMFLPTPVRSGRFERAPTIIRPMAVEIIRDPLWNNIRLDPLSFELIDTPAFPRLRYVRQLGLAFLGYPAAPHSRF